MFGARQGPPAIGRAVLLSGVVGVLAVLCAAHPPNAVPLVHAQAPSLHYAAGWNLVAVPTGTLLDQAAGTLYTLRPTANAYQPVGRNGLTGGRAVWAYFPQDSDVAVGTTAADFSRLLLPPDTYALIGNPSTTQTLPLHGADVAFSYDARTGYQAVTELQPGQGAFVLSYQGGDVTLGTVPAGAESIRALQAGLTQDASDWSSLAALPGVAEKLIEARQYNAVQAGIDDVTAAFADGLVAEHASTVPLLTDQERGETVGVRQALASAQAAMAAGDTSSADAAVAGARQQAQASEDQAAASMATPGTALVGSAFRYSAANYTSGSLARYGTLCTASTPALGLNLAPSPQFVDLVKAVLAGAPPAPSSTPPGY